MGGSKRPTSVSIPSPNVRPMPLVAVKKGG